MTSGQGTENKLRTRPMEPEDISAVLEIDRKISRVQRAVTYTDLITGDLGGCSTSVLSLKSVVKSLASFWHGMLMLASRLSKQA